MVFYPFNPKKELENVQDQLQKMSDDRRHHNELVAEIERATGKKLITVDGVEYYVNPAKLNLLIEGE